MLIEFVQCRLRGGDALIVLRQDLKLIARTDSQSGCDAVDILLIIEESEKLVIIKLGQRIEFVIVALSASTVRPSHTAPVVFTRSTTASTRNCSASVPPSWFTSVLR